MADNDAQRLLGGVLNYHAAATQAKIIGQHGQRRAGWHHERKGTRGVSYGYLARRTGHVHPGARAWLPISFQHHALEDGGLRNCNLGGGWLRGGHGGRASSNPRRLGRASRFCVRLVRGSLPSAGEQERYG